MAESTEPGAVVSRITSRVLEVCAQLLDGEEREAVLGDLHELGIGQGRAVFEILGLVMRRQAAAWADWRPWFRLIGLILPLALLVSIVARQSTGESSVYVWMYANNLDLDLLRNRGFWYELAHCLPFVLNMFLKLFCCSWIAGFVIGCVSMNRPRLNRAMLLLTLVAGVFFGAPAYLNWRWHLFSRATHLAALPDAHAPLAANLFYRVIFPGILALLLVIVPGWWGHREGLKTRYFRRALFVAVWILSIAAIAEMLLQNAPLWLLSPSHSLIVLLYGLHLAFPPVLLYWPVLFLIGNAATKHLNRRNPIAT
jgi:hypothetical protein